MVLAERLAYTLVGGFFHELLTVEDLMTTIPAVSIYSILNKNSDSLSGIKKLKEVESTRHIVII